MPMYSERTPTNQVSDKKIRKKRKRKRKKDVRN